MARTDSFVPAGVYLLDFLTPGLQRCFGKARKSPAFHSSDLLATHLSSAGSPAAFVFISYPWVGGGARDRERVGRVISPPSFGCAGALAADDEPPLTGLDHGSALNCREARNSA